MGRQRKVVLLADREAKAGVFDLLAPPFNERLVLSVLEHAVFRGKRRERHEKFRTAAVVRGVSARKGIVSDAILMA